MKKITLGSMVTATLLLIGCGGGSSSSPIITPSVEPTSTPISDNSNKKVGTGYYVDEAVEGVNFICGEEEGITDHNGMFKFEHGKHCRFRLGYLNLREVNASDLEDNISIIEDNITVAKLLQTIDKDGNATNGIQILEDTADIMKESNIDTIPTEDALLDTIRENLKAKHQDEYNGTVVTTEEAKAHIEHTQTVLEEEGRRTQHSSNRMSVTNSDENNDSVELDNEEDNEIFPNNMSEENNETTHNQAQNDMNDMGNGIKNVTNQDEEHGNQNENMEESSSNVMNPSQEHGNQNENTEDSSSNVMNQGQEHGNESSQNIMNETAEGSSSVSNLNNNENSSNNNFFQNPMNSNDTVDSSENNNSSSNSDDNGKDENSSNGSSNSDDNGKNESSSNGSSNSDDNGKNESSSNGSSNSDDDGKNESSSSSISSSSNGNRPSNRR